MERSTCMKSIFPERWMRPFPDVSAYGYSHATAEVGI
jgi:hypothetical protein